MERRARPTVTIRPPGAPLAAGIVGGCYGLVASGVIVGSAAAIGPSLGGWWALVFLLVWLAGGAALGLLLRRVTYLRFEPDRLVVARPTGVRKIIPWEHVQHVRATFEVNDNVDVRSRWLALGVRRDHDTHVVRLGVRMPDPGVDAHPSKGLRRLRCYQAVVDELEARGFRIPQ